MGGNLVALALSVGVGVITALQALINGLLGRTLAAPFAATLVSVSVGTVAAALIYAGSGEVAEWRAPPLWLYLVGGLLGIGIVSGSLVLAPRLGAGAFFAAAVLGQLVAGMLLDHYGAFGLVRHEITPARLGAVGCVMVGVVLMRIL